MLLNLNDPSSIVAWWKLMPERHGLLLMDFARMWPQFALPVRAAVRRIKSDAALKDLYELGMTSGRAANQQWADRNDADAPRDAQLAA